MSIEVNKDQPRYDRPVANGNVPIDTKHVKTEVVVENGGTIVIGGIYTQDVSNNTVKIPLLPGSMLPSPPCRPPYSPLWGTPQPSLWGPL